MFWCGDFNYRVSLEREEAVQAARDQVVCLRAEYFTILNHVCTLGQEGQPAGEL